MVHSTTSSTPLVVLCGLDGEAQTWRGTGVPVLCSATNSERARHLVQPYAQKGYTLLSFGTAGGLDPHLTSGTLVIATSVQVGNHDRISCTPALVEGLQNALPQAHCGDVLSDERLIASPTDKRTAHDQDRCAIVDMESGAVARAAQDYGCAFAVVRVVLDAASDALPPLAQLPLSPHGKPVMGAVLRSLIRNPAQIPDVVRIARLWRNARGILRRSVPCIAQRL